MFSNIYVFTNKINNKKYVGQSINPYERYKQHLKDAKKDNLLFHNALMKYGVDNFSFEIIEGNIPIDMVSDREQFWIKHYQSKKPNGYNLTDGGEGTIGYKHTAETKRKMSSAKQGFIPVMTEETKRKISIANKGKVLSEKQIKRLRDINKGRKHSEESKRKMSLKRKGIPKSPEHVQKVVESLKNRTDEEKQRAIQKAVNTKKRNNYDFAKHFKLMSEDEKTLMYDKISKNNPRSKAISGRNIQTNEILTFNSIGKAGKYMHEINLASKNAKQTIREALEKGTNAYGYKWEYI